MQKPSVQIEHTLLRSSTGKNGINNASTVGAKLKEPYLNPVLPQREASKTQPQTNFPSTADRRNPKPVFFLSYRDALRASKVL